MNAFSHLLDLALHLDAHLLELTQEYGAWVYAVLFVIVFCETGLVVTPFLPGDSLLFAAGTLVALGVLAPVPLLVVLIVAAVVGDAVNYSIGRYFGDRAHRVRRINQKHLRRTELFFEHHGGKTIVIARFVPIVRTFAPFTAGMASMAYRRFASYNVSGALLWIGTFVAGGWAFGTLPVVRDHLTFVMLGIIVVSVAIPVLEYAVRKTRSRRITAASAFGSQATSRST